MVFAQRTGELRVEATITRLKSHVIFRLMDIPHETAINKRLPLAAWKNIRRRPFGITFRSRLLCRFKLFICHYLELCNVKTSRGAKIFAKSHFDCFVRGCG